MATRLISVVVDAADLRRLAGFWAAALDWLVTVDEPDEVAVEAGLAAEWGDGGAPCLSFVPVPERKRGKNRVHLDLSSPSAQAQHATVDRLLGLGASRVDVGQGQVPWVVLRSGGFRSSLRSKDALLASSFGLWTPRANSLKNMDSVRH